MDTLGSDAFASTQDNAAAGDGNTNPRLSLKQQAQVRLSAQGFGWLQREFEATLSRHGRLPEADLSRLDWPMFSNQVEQMVIEFDNQRNPNADIEFQAWCKQYPNGFYLNGIAPKKFMLHKSECPHAGFLAPGNLPTSNPKFCSLDRAELEKWSFEKGAKVEACKTCL
ncbi:MAG: hypothetical protein WBN75_15410 [Verrucomicrobiia bacterium]